MTVGLGETVCFAGSASGLSFEAICNPSEIVNGCGVHIHSGTACDNADTQGGHLYDMVEDPWQLVGYPTTDENGKAVFGSCVYTGSLASAALSKPFIVHERDGSRAICGLLKSNGNQRHVVLRILFLISLAIVLVIIWILKHHRVRRRLVEEDMTDLQLAKSNYTDNPNFELT